MSSDEGMVLVTGASGYIATHIVQQLLKADYKVRGTVRSLENEQKVKPLQNLCPAAKYSLELVEADLTNPDCWLDVVKGCTKVFHIASPVPAEEPKHEDEVIKPAVEGTLNVLRACQAAGGVKRVVLTSSYTAIGSGHGDVHNRTFTEKDWSIVETTVLLYSKSKTLAERAAWDFVEQLPDEEKFEMAVINPSLVLGPVLCGGDATSVSIPMKMMNMEMLLLPKLAVGFCDVREVAAAHINAMELPEAAGHRHIANTKDLWMKEMAQIMDEEFRPQGYKIATTEAPKFLMHIVGWFNPMIKLMLALPGIGMKPLFDNTRYRNVLGINPRPVEETILDMCYDLIDSGKVKKTPQYKPRV